MIDPRTRKEHAEDAEWEKELEEKISTKIVDGNGDIRTIYDFHPDDIKSFIRSLLRQERIKALQEASRIAQESKATFFITQGEKPLDLGKDGGEALHELKAEIVTNIERRIYELEKK